MRRSLCSLLGYSIEASDGSIGTVHNFFFDDTAWVVRYLVAEAGGWLHSRKVLLAPASLGHPLWNKRVFPVKLTRAQVRGQPDIDAEKPVSRQHELAMSNYYGWPAYWSIEPLISVPVAVPEPEAPAVAGDPHLRSAREVVTYRVQASDGVAGPVADMIVHEETWAIEHVVVDMGAWRHGLKILLPTSMVKEISWPHREVVVAAKRADIAALPPFNPAAPINTQVEEHHYDYYGRRTD